MRSPTSSRLLLCAALLLALGAAGCRGVGPAGGDWAFDASHIHAAPAPESTTVSSDASSPVGALLAVFFRKDDEPSRGHVRVEPTPIVTEKTLGFGLTLHW